MAGRLLIGLVTAGLVAVMVSGAVVYRWVATAPAGATGETVLFTVAAGEPYVKVVKRLESNGLLRHPRALTVYGRVRGYDREVKAGTYKVSDDERPVDILARLVGGDVYKITVTVPEGLMKNEIVRIVAEAAQVDSAAVAEAINDPLLMQSLGVEAPSMEGYLFPDTYHLPWAIEARELVATMVRALDAVFDDAKRRRAQAMGMTRNEVLTLASIIEAECRLRDEQPTISAVYHNRLDRNMRLEADPTVAYAKGMYRGRLFYKDLQIDSPYNTYKYAGLPPGPICSPGTDAILAALYPDTTSSALYFVARGDGGHVFSNTLKDHLIAVKAHRERRAAQQNSPSGR